MRFVQPFVLAVALFCAPMPAKSGDWLSQPIEDHLRGRVGVGVGVGGLLEGDRGNQPGLLRAYCADNQTVTLIEAPGHFMGAQGVSVRYRLDDGPVQNARWDTCKDGRCAGLWGGQGIPFLKSLYGKRELKIVIERRFAGPINGTFHVEGAEQAIRDVGEACGWIPKAKN